MGVGRHRKDKYAVRPGSASGSRPKSASGRPRTAEGGARPGTAKRNKDTGVRLFPTGGWASAQWNPPNPIFQDGPDGIDSIPLDGHTERETRTLQALELVGLPPSGFGLPVPGTQFMLPGHENERNAIGSNEKKSFRTVDSRAVGNDLPSSDSDLESDGDFENQRMPDASGIFDKEPDFISPGVRYMKYMKFAVVLVVLGMFILSLKYTVLKQDMKG
eukprot:2698800-Pyramimonas_sp.AAC.1